MRTIGARWKAFAPQGGRPAPNSYNAATFREVFMTIVRAAVAALVVVPITWEQVANYRSVSG